MDVGATGATRRVPDFRLPANERSVSPCDLRRTPPGRFVQFRDIQDDMSF